MITHLVLLQVVLLSLYSTTSTYDLTAADKQRLVDAHNSARTRYGVTVPLVWDDTIMASAKSYSDRCIFAHSQAPNLGENLGYAGVSNLPPSFPYHDVAQEVNSWIAEEKSWTCSNNACSGTCGHFTQVVWKATTKVGCGLTPCVFGGFYSQYLVCQYSSAGNYNNQHPLNAPSSSPVCPGTVPPPVTSPTPTSVKPPITSPTPTSVKPPITSPTPPPSGGYSGCKVICSQTSTYCIDVPQIMSNKVYCKCNPSSSMMWPVQNAGTAACTYWPAGLPKPIPFDQCTTDCNNNVQTFCQGAPTSFSGDPTLYCACGDPGGYMWPVTNLNTPQCQYQTSSAVSDTSATSQGSSDLTTGQWVGVCIGVAIISGLLVAVIFLVLRNRNAEVV